MLLFCNEELLEICYTQHMSFFFRRSSDLVRPGSIFGSSLLSAAIVCLAFGIAILINPDLIAYLVAFFFILVGLSLLGTWWNMRR